MSSSPSRRVVALYEWTTWLMPASHRCHYGDEQVRLFERVWREECPSGYFARVWWTTRLLGSAVIAAVGVWLDQWRRAATAQRAHKSGGGSMGSDFRFTIRSVKASPWYAAAVIGVTAVTLALATTTFAIVDGVLFRPLPYPDAQSLVKIAPDFSDVAKPVTRDGITLIYTVSEVDVRNWQAAVPEVPITAFSAGRWSGLGPGVNDSSAGIADVQSNFFDVIGVAPLFGGFSEADFLTASKIRPVLVTHDAWIGRFQGAANVIGHEVISDRAGGYGVRVVGVLPKGFSFPSSMADVQFLAPLVIPAGARNNPKVRNITEVVARLPEGFTPAVLSERLASGLAATAAQFPPLGSKPDGWSDTGWRRQGPYDAVEIAPLSATLARRSGPLFQAVFAAVALLTLLAGANVSSLMTARALERQQEIDVRRSLGATSFAITRLWFAEASSLLLIGGVTGVIATPMLLDLIIHLLPDSVVLLKPARLDWRVAGFVAGTLVLLSVFVALAPSRRSLKKKLGQARGASERVQTIGRFVVVAGQVCVAFVLTVVGALLVGSLLTVYARDQPIRTNGVVALRVMFQGPGASMSRSDERAARERAIRERLQRVPGVSSVASTGAQVLGGGGAQSWFTPPNGTTRPDNIDTWPVTPGFYDTLELELTEGRVPSNEELRTSSPLIVVSESVARAYWPGRSPLGEVLADAQTKEAFVVVGVAKDVRWLAWDIETPVIYAPYAALSRAPWLTYFLRTDANTGQVTAAALRAIEERDPLARVSTAGTLDESFRDSVSIRRFQSWLFGGFAAAALIVVGVGVLGLLAMSAARRTREVGIRCALGATPGSVTAMMVREQLGPVGAGLLAGGAVAAWAVGFVEGYLYQLTTTDPRVWAAAAVSILATAAIGTLVPAVRASRIDPLKALRTE